MRILPISPSKRRTLDISPQDQPLPQRSAGLRRRTYVRLVAVYVCRIYVTPIDCVGHLYQLIVWIEQLVEVGLEQSKRFARPAFGLYGILSNMAGSSRLIRAFLVGYSTDPK